MAHLAHKSIKGLKETTTGKANKKPILLIVSFAYFSAFLFMEVW